MIESITLNVFHPERHEPQGTVKRYGVRVGPFLVHRPTEIVSVDGGPFGQEPGWRVTHIASGRNTTPTPLCCYRHARKLAEKLRDAGLNWDFGKPEAGTRFDRGMFPAWLRPDMERAKKMCWEHKSVCGGCSRAEVVM